MAFMNLEKTTKAMAHGFCGLQESKKAIAHGFHDLVASIQDIPDRVRPVRSVIRERISSASTRPRDPRQLRVGTIRPWSLLHTEMCAMAEITDHTCEVV